MQFEILRSSLCETLCDTVVLGIYSDGLSPAGQTQELDKLLNGQINALLLEQPKLGKWGEITVIHTLGLISAKRVIVAGLGTPTTMTRDKLRSVMGTIIRTASKLGARVISVYPADFPGDPADVIACFTEGALLGDYRFTNYKTTDDTLKSTIEKIVFAIPSEIDMNLSSSLIKQTEIIARSVLFARDLVNHPASIMTPTKMAWHATEIARQYGLDSHILDKADMEKLGMHAFLAVAQGTQEPPKLIVLKYKGNPDDNDYIGFIGKGITFDSGGISLKPSEGMEEMKTDMAGGAAVLGAMLGISQLKLRLNIIAVVPCTENMPSGTSLKPGDIISSMAGKSIEVVNTDAEGRLLLADAITYAKQLGAGKLLDLATLTGACVIALGNITAGIISNNDYWCNQILQASDKSGEKMWRLPAFEEYKEQIKSPVADLKNSGGRPAGAITAGLFIAEFVGSTPWVHIDIAGTATIAKDNGYNVKGATGTGVRTLIQLAQDLASHAR